VRVRVQVQCRNQVLLGYEYRRPVRGLVTGLERELLQRQELLRFPALRRPQERGPFRGQGLPQPYRGQRRPDNSETRIQRPETRTLGRRKSWDVRAGPKSEARCQMAEVRSADSGMTTGDVTFGGGGFSNTVDRIGRGASESSALVCRR